MKTYPAFHAPVITTAFLVIVACSGLWLPGGLSSSAGAAELNASDWSGIRAAREAARHDISADEGGGHVARNPGQRWVTRFDGRGFLTEPESGGWEWGLQLESYGFDGDEQPISGRPDAKADEQRLTYAWSGALEEWFVNDARGLEHGFTVKERPGDRESMRLRDYETMRSEDYEKERQPRTASSHSLIVSQSHSLSFTLAVRGSLTPVITTDARGVQFKDESGITVVNYSGLKVWDADGKILPAHFTMAESSLRLRVDESGARYPLTIDPIAQQAQITPAIIDTGDGFGNSVSIDGNTVVIGAPYEGSNATGVGGDASDNSASNSGAVYVFTRSGSTWTQQAYIKASNTEANDRFGWWVDISGDTIAVGANGEDSNATGVGGDQNDNTLPSTGAVYVFTRTGTTWTQQAYIKASNTNEYDNFGYTVALDGDTLVVTAPYEASNATGINGNQADNSLEDAGAAYVFTRNGTTWTQQAYIKASNTGQGDGFGYGIGFSGDTLVIGAPYEKSNATGVNGNQADNSADYAGAAYVFTRSGTVWSQEAYIKASNTGVNDYFGNQLAVSGDTIVIAAPGESSNATGVDGNQADNSAESSGAAYVFTRSGTAWTQEAYIKASNTGQYDSFGTSVALAGDALVIGAIGEASNATGINGNQADNSVEGAGAAYVFARAGTNWSQTAYLKASADIGTYDYFGQALGLSGDTLICSAYGKTTGPTALYSGTAYVFTGLAEGPPPAPEIGVEQPVGTPLADGGTKSFGNVILGSDGSLIFTIKNTGTADLTGLGITVDGTHASQFVVTALPTAPVAGGGSTTFTVKFTPASFGVKTAALHIANNDANESPFDITLTGTGISSPPTISDVADQTVNEDVPTSALAITLTDADTSLAALTMSGVSGNTTLVPNGSIVFGGSGANRTVTVTPALNASGTATITISVSDETNTVSDTFLLTVNAVNDAPIITDIADQGIVTNGVTGALSFTISDVDTPFASLTFSKSSSNQTLVPDANVVVTGAGPTRTVTITPAANENGSATITLSAADDQSATGTETFLVTVAANTPPTLLDIVQQAFVKASNTGAQDFFGFEVDVSGETVVVGASGEDSNASGVNGDQANNSASFAGAVYVFVRNSGVWSQQAYLKASNAQAGDAFSRVAISGDTIVVGATNEASNAAGVNGDQSNNSLPESGAAYVFTRSGTTWTQQAYLKASNPGAGDYFGGHVDIDGDTIIVSAHYEDSSASGVNGDPNNNGISNSGAAYVFTRNGTTWTQQAYLKSSNPGELDTFGASVAVSGDTVVVGATEEDSDATGVNGDPNDNGFQNGAVYVFTRSGTTWMQQAYLKGSNTGQFDGFGYAVAINGDDLVVGTPYEQSNAIGVNASLSGGSGTQSDNSADDSGAVYVFNRSGTTWSQQAYLKPSATQTGDFFGHALDIVGNTVVVGAVGDDNNQGTAFIFKRTGASWSQTVRTARVRGVPDQFGGDVAMSGTTVVMGALGEASNATGVNGDETNNSASFAGAAYVFGLPGSTPPTISVIANQAIAEDAATGNIAFTVGDAETPVAALTVSGTSSNTALVPNANITHGGSGANRTVMLTPLANAFGTTTITLTVDDGSSTSSTAFVLTVTGVNDGPTISDIADRTIDEDNSTGAVLFTIGDIDNAAGTLTMSGTSSNTNTVPNANIVIGGSGANRTVTVTPVPEGAATLTITVTVSDGALTASDSFVLTINSINDLPTITPIADLTMNEDQTNGTRFFTVNDPDLSANNLTVSGSSSNTELVPNASITFGDTGVGGGANRFVIINPAPNAFGTATITVSVFDLFATVTTTFLVTVNPVNDVPAISDVGNQSIPLNGNTGALAITVGDIDNAASSLTMSGSSSNTTLVPNANIVFSGSGAGRTVTITPAAAQHGSVTITLTVSDGIAISSDTFVLTVRSIATISEWRQQFFGTSSNTGIFADTADFDRDGISNLIEYAFGLNPTLSSVGQLPAAQRTGTTLGFNFTEPPGITGITYGAQYTPTLVPANWQPVTDTGTPPQHIFSVNTGSTTRGFMRLTVSNP